MTTEEQTSERGAIMGVREKLIRIIDRALDELTPESLVTDRQALKNLTGALKDLQELQELQEASEGARKRKDGESEGESREERDEGLRVRFSDETARMSE